MCLHYTIIKLNKDSRYESMGYQWSKKKDPLKLSQNGVVGDER